MRSQDKQGEGRRRSGTFTFVGCNSDPDATARAGAWTTVSAADEEDGVAVNERPCIKRVAQGSSETTTFVAWASVVIQDEDVAIATARKMLAGQNPYEYNEDEPALYETFSVTDRAALEAQIADAERSTEQ